MQKIVAIIKNTSLSSIAFGFVMLIVGYGCANPLPPSGGPDDTKAPEISEFTPQNATLNFKDQPIKIKFSEYVDKNSVIENIRITPELPLEFSWSGKRLEITPSDTMRDNLTYCISIEPNYKDLSGNKPQSAFSLIFSTGSSIDSGKVKGKVYSKAQGFSAFAYRIDNINPDTLNITTTKPDYKIKIGSSGDFSIQALKDGTYRLFMINDRNENGLYTAGYEEFSAATKDIKVTATDSISPNNSCNFYISALIDNSAPELNAASCISDRTVSLIFSEAIDASSVNIKSFSIIDTVSKNKVSIISTYQSPTKKSNLNLILDKALDTAAVYYCEIDNSINPIRDSAANAMSSVIRSEAFSCTSVKQIDSLKFKTTMLDSAKQVKLNSSFAVQFNQPIIAGRLDSFALINKSNNKKVPYSHRIVNNSELEFTPQFDLQSNIWYQASLKMDSIYSVSGDKLPDTTLAVNFLTEDLRLSGSLSGTIKPNSIVDSNTKFIVLLDANGGRNQYSAISDSAMNWSFTALPEGEYTLNIIRDTNGNGMYDVGEAYPYKAAELYYPINRKIKIIQRWKVQDLIIELPE